MSDAALLICIGLPLAVSLLLSLRSIGDEHAIARLALGSTMLTAGASLLAIALWLAGGADAIHTRPHDLVARGDYRFTFALVLDGTAAVMLALSGFITGMVMRFSRFYLHREPGFQRFFAIVLLFQAGMHLLILAANLEVMFAGWELVGLSSFLLIGFYRERQSAVRSALKTYSVYRIADIGLLLAASLEGARDRFGLGGFILLAAMGKSAQVPFGFWIVRAMEGPTPSSALFYGALSVHAGAYLLLRTFDVWAAEPMVRICVGVVGLATATLCSMFSRVQPTIKGQIGYASVTQVGIIFIEIALGLTHLALLHIVCNALLRCYQLLVSPSVVAHRLRQQASAGAARVRPLRSLYARLIPERMWPTLYVFALSEGYLKDLLQAVLWFPLRKLGRLLLRYRVRVVALGLICAAMGLIFGRDSRYVALASSVGVFLFALAFSACGLSQWRKPMTAVCWISGSSLLAAAAVEILAGGRHGAAASFYALGIALSWVLSLGGFAWAASGGVNERFSGRLAARPFAGSIAFVGALGLAGFPLLPTFWGEDLLVHSTLGEFRGLSLALAVAFALNGYLAIRNFAYTFFGQPDLVALSPGLRDVRGELDQMLTVGLRRPPREEMADIALSERGHAGQ